MIDFKSTLLREKFTIREGAIEETSPRSSLVAMSNRMALELTDAQGNIAETLIVRAHNMHSCVRLCARLIQAFIDGGPILNRPKPFDWDESWENIIEDYERAHNPDLWVAVYSEGKIVFERGKHHALLDMIEKCDFTSEEPYDYSVAIAEESFQKAGKDVTIEYDGKMAMVATFEEGFGKCAFILRHPNRTTTFNFKAHPLAGGREVSISQCLSAGAALLEGIQLAFTVGMNNEKMNRGLIKRYTDAEQKTKDARQRLGRLGEELNSLENTYNVHYRPERPEFQEIVTDSEERAGRIFKG